MKRKFHKIKFSKIVKPFIYDDERFLRWQRRLIIYGLPTLVIFLTAHFFLNPQLPLKSVMWSSALGVGSYMLVVSMIRPGTKRFWLIFITALTLSTISMFFEEIAEYTFLPMALTMISFIIYNFFLAYKEHKRCAIKQDPSKLFKGKLRFKKTKK